MLALAEPPSTPMKRQRNSKRSNSMLLEGFRLSGDVLSSERGSLIMMVVSNVTQDGVDAFVRKRVFA